eukprot:4516579-Pyramimonas_sp.AAC.1
MPLDSSLLVGFRGSRASTLDDTLKMHLVFFTFSRVLRLHSASTLDRYSPSIPLYRYGQHTLKMPLVVFTFSRTGSEATLGVYT